MGNTRRKLQEEFYDHGKPAQKNANKVYDFVGTLKRECVMFVDYLINANVSPSFFNCFRCFAIRTIKVVRSFFQ